MNMRFPRRLWSAMALSCLVLSVFGSSLAVTGIDRADAAIDDDLGSVYLIIGQSNAAGRGVIPANSGAYPGVSVANSNNNMIPATPNLNDYSTVGAQTGHYSLGYTFAGAMSQVTGNDIDLVVNARGGTSIRYWLPDGVAEPDTGLNLYDAAVDRTQDVLAQSGGKLAGVVWHQGEADRNDTGYMDDLKILIDSLRDEFNDPDLAFVAGELSYDRLDDNEAFNDRLAEVTTFGNASFASAEGLPTDDGTHFVTSSLQEFGDRYAYEMLQLHGLSENEIPEWDHTFGDDTPTGESFDPVAGEAYTLQAGSSFLAGDSGSARDSYAVASSADLDAVSWKFVDAGNGFFHIDLASGGTYSRLSSTTKVDTAARLTKDKFVNEAKYFALTEVSKGSGTYYVTATEYSSQPDHQRLSLSSNDAAFVSQDAEGTSVVFTISPANEDDEDDEDTPTVPPTTGGAFVPVDGQSYALQAGNSSFLAGDSGSARDTFASASSADADAVSWEFVDAGNGFFHIDLAVGGTYTRVSSTPKIDSYSRLAKDKFSGSNTYFAITEVSEGSGTYYVTAIDLASDPGHQRLSVGSNDVTFVSSDAVDASVVFTIAVVG